MKVLNGKRSTLTFQLDNGEVVKIKPGEFSTPFVGNAALIRTIIGSGKPNQIGFVVSNSYELKMVQSVPLATKYYHATEEEAKNVILAGADFEPKKAIYTDPLAEAEINRLNDKLKSIEELAKVNKEVAEDAKKKLAEAEAKIEQLTTAPKELETVYTKDNFDELTAERDLYKSKYEAAVQSNEQLKTNFELLQKKAIEVGRESETKDEKIAELNSVIEQLRAGLKDAEAKLTAPIAPPTNRDGKTLEELTELHDKLKEEATAEMAKLNAEIAQLKEDGAKLYENYTRAKEAATTMMEKFGISYIDGQYVIEG